MNQKDFENQLAREKEIADKLISGHYDREVQITNLLRYGVSVGFQLESLARKIESESSVQWRALIHFNIGQDTPSMGCVGGRSCPHDAVLQAIQRACGTINPRSP